MSPAPADPERLLAAAQVELANIADEAVTLTNALQGRVPRSSTTTDSYDIPGGVRLPDGTSVSEVRVSRTRFSGDPQQVLRVEGFDVANGNYRRLPVSLANTLTPPPGPSRGR